MDYASIQKLSKGVYRPKKIAVCTAWGSPFCWTHAAYNMANLTRPEGVEVRYLPGFGWCPARRHMQGVEEAIKWGATHICFWGADQINPGHDMLVKFTKHMENGWPVAAARVPVRGWIKSEKAPKPFMKLAYRWKDGLENKVQERKFDINHLELVDPKDGDLQEIVTIGSGALMFDVNVLYRLKKPWFVETVRDDDYNRIANMDTRFTWRLVTEANARILCDLTIDVVHIDILPIEEWMGDRFMDWPKWKAQEGVNRYI